MLPAAVDFLQNFNDDNYDILLQARDYYKFAVLVLAAMGLLFQLPVAILAVTRMGISRRPAAQAPPLRDPRDRGPRGAAAGRDPVTMLLMMLPLLFLYEGSILLASLLDRRAARVRAREEAAETGDRLDALDPTTTDALRPQRFRPPQAVKIVYVTLAFLMGGGLVLFGIGGSGALSGGLVDAITERSGSGDDGTERFASEEQQAAAAGAREPERRRALGRARPRTVQPRRRRREPRPGRPATTPRPAVAELLCRGRAWEEHLELAGEKPDDRASRA